MRWDRSSIEALSEGLKILGIVLVLMMFMVWQHVDARRLEKQVEVLRKEEDKLVFQNARLQSQINQWMTPSHLESLARNQLKMGPLDARRRIGMDLS